MFSETYGTCNSKICRICLKSCGSPLYIFGEININNRNLKECLEKMCDISVSLEDNLPDSICSKCTELLEQSYSFRLLAQKNDDFLRKIHDCDYLNDNRGYYSSLVSKSSESTKSMNSEYISESIISTGSKNSEDEYIVIKAESHRDENIPDELNEENDHNDDDCISKEELFVEEDCFQYNDSKTRVDNLEEDVQEMQIQKSPNFYNFEETQLQQQQQQPQPKEKNFECKFCGQKFVYLKNQRQHEQRHVKEGNRECQVCDRKFYTNYDLRRHLYTHRNEKRYKCERCEKFYLTQAELNRHLKSHESVKKYKCLHCEKDFHELGVLNFHTKTVHLSEKRHQCNTCGKYFVTPSKVRRHQRSKACSQTKSVKTVHVEDEFVIHEDWSTLN